MFIDLILVLDHDLNCLATTVKIIGAIITT